MLKRCLVGTKYRCQKCNKLFKKIVVDHIEPVIQPGVGFKGWDTYYARLFVPEEKLQGLCKKCHAVKTKEENRQRKTKGE